MYKDILTYCQNHDTKLVAVSKTKPNDAIQYLYDQGQRIFGENKVQEVVGKYDALPKDIEWHLIGHLQKNKVKYIAPFIAMIHSIDSLELLQVIDKEAAKNKRIINVLLQFHIAQEDTKFGLSQIEAADILQHISDSPLMNIRICGVMGMASFTDDELVVRSEFKALKAIFEDLRIQYFGQDPAFCEISMGMSGDYAAAIAEGSTMVRVGSAIFGSR